MSTKRVIVAFWLVLAMQSSSCKHQSSSKPTAEAKAGHADERDEQGKGHAHEDGAKRRPSDLDRPMEELFGATCEHKKKTFECDECRYEVGVVRAASALTRGGLIKTVKVDRRKVAVPVTLTGEIRFDERRVGHVSSQVQGVIKKVHVALGDPVKSGQALLEIESVAIGDAQAAYLETQAMLELARRSFERVAALRKENIASEKEFLQAKHELETAGIRSRGAFGKLIRLGTDGARGRLVVRAPMDGAVLVMHAVSGEVAKPDEPLVTVGDNQTVWVWADLYERDIAVVKRGQATQQLTAAIGVKAYPCVEFPGTVSLVSLSMDKTSRTVKTRIEVKNPDGRLLSGMFTTVKLFLPGAEEVLAVPADSVLEDEGRSFVFVHHHDDYYVRRPVVVGRTWAGLVEIRKGLEPAQTVVTEGAFLMKSDVLRSKMGAGCAD